MKSPQQDQQQRQLEPTLTCRGVQTFLMQEFDTQTTRELSIAHNNHATMSALTAQSSCMIGRQTAGFGYTGQCQETHNHICDHPSLHSDSAQNSNSTSNRHSHNVAAKGRHLGQTNTCANEECTSGAAASSNAVLSQ